MDLSWNVSVAALGHMHLEIFHRALVTTLLASFLLAAIENVGARRNVYINQCHM